MILGFLVMDFLYLLGLLALLTASCEASWHSWQYLSPILGPAPALVVAILAFGLTWLVSVFLMALALPRLRPGRYRMMRHRQFFIWILHTLVRRYLDLPPLSILTAQFNTLRFVMLRAMGAKVHFTTSMSSDVLVLDPSLFQAGPGSMIGAQTILAGHFVAGNLLVLGKLSVGKDVNIAGKCVLGPATSIGDGSKLDLEVQVAMGVKIEPKVQLHHHVKVEPYCSIGQGAKVQAYAVVPQGTKIEAGASFSARS